MPVLPAVPAPVSPPRSITLRRSASSTMYFAARSFTDPPGFRNSALPRIVQPVSSDALRSLISGVLPTASTKSSRMPAVAERRRSESLMHAPFVAPNVADRSRPAAAGVPAPAASARIVHSAGAAGFRPELPMQALLRMRYDAAVVGGGHNGL